MLPAAKKRGKIKILHGGKLITEEVIEILVSKKKKYAGAFTSHFGCILAVLFFFLPVGAEEAKGAEVGFGEEVSTVFKSEDGHTLVVPVGEVYGMRIFADGIIVSEITEVYSSGAAVSPAEAAGLLCGDVLLKVGGQPVNTCEEFTSLVENSAGNPLEILYRRRNENRLTTLHPVKSDADGLWKAGLWIKDATAGIGTLTFVDPETGVFGSLGHGICDGDTGELLPCRKGELLQVELGEIRKSTEGVPGELTGSLCSGALGSIEQNSQQGVYGSLFVGATGENALEAAFREEIHTGPAQILADPDGDGAEYYSAEIERINPQSNAENRNFIICVTDERLLALTGGIVQGMSGSPIIQDGKLVGAVTHVLVNDPTRGYGIFIENMLEATG